ncbi:Gldg family protein [Tychonema sp. LEGE 07203]|uniref:GldG family protein n=1 Tax=Tychonema sp. LEGE 07203 TaxID=1828671 RepID=UPI00188133EE|nr:Gldg family protein [Tychonema sp. LEGE 07203]MBE9097449.1 Gldg family protein [Tychonema sp. LEGE 07203]
MKISKKNWKYIFWLGPLLTAAGITARLVSEAWEPLTVGLVIAGVVTIALGLLYLTYEQGFWGQRSTQAGTNALIATAAVFAILAVINFIAFRYPLRIDLTESQQFTLAPQTQQILRNLPKPVKVWVFDPIQNPQIKELLQSYKREGGEKFQFEFVDPQAQPGTAREFSITSIGEVYLQSGDKKQVLQKGGTAFGSDPNQGLSEIKLTNGLEEILSTRVPTVYFLQDKGTRPLTEGQGGIQQAQKALKDKYYNVQTLNLTERKEVPEDADALIVAGPEQPFSDTEIKELKAYLDRGGSLFLMVDPAINIGLDQFLQEWGVKLDTRLVIDASGTGQRFGLGPTVPTVRRYGDNPITKSFGTGISFYPFARALETTPVAGIEEQPLLWTSQESWAESDLTTKKLEFDPKTDRQGPLLLGVALVRGADSTPLKSSPSPSPSPTTSPSPTASPSLTDSPSPTTSPSPTASPSLTDSPSPTTSPSPTDLPTTSPSPTDLPTTSPSPTDLPTTSPSPTDSPSPTTSPTASPISYSVIVSQEATPPVLPTTSPTPTTSPAPSPNPTATPSVPSDSQKTARMIVIGTSQFVTNGWFEQQLNSDVFINSVSWLSKPDQQSFSISPKKATNRRINMTVVQVGLLVLAWLVWPLLGLVIGGTIWWKRR